MFASPIQSKKLHEEANFLALGSSEDDEVQASPGESFSAETKGPPETLTDHSSNNACIDVPLKNAESYFLYYWGAARVGL